MKIIETKYAPAAIGPYSQGFIVNGLVYTSGQIPVNPEDRAIKSTINDQVDRVVRMWGRFSKKQEVDLNMYSRLHVS